MSFDTLAPFYRAMESVVAGRRLQRCRTTLLPVVRGAREILVAGEGPGRWIEAACGALPEARITVVDASARMLREAEKAWRGAGGTPERIRFVHARLPDEGLFPPGRFDLIVTPFFLDCFAPEEMQAVISSLAPWLTREAQWLVCDFQMPRRGMARWRAQVSLALAHVFFRVTTGISARRWTDPRPFLTAQGFVPQWEVLTDWGLLGATLWGRPERE